MFFADGRIVVDANVELDCNRKNANIHARLGFIIGISIHGLREARPSIVNIIAEIIHVPSALVMKVESPNIKVFVSSESNGNPYERDELAPLNTGLYCETVMKTRQSLLVPDALRDEEWKSNPDIKLGMISYLGFPVTWPDGQVFGTILRPR